MYTCMDFKPMVFDHFSLEKTRWWMTVDNAVTCYALSHASVNITIYRLVIIGGSVDLALKIFWFRSFGNDLDGPIGM